MEKKEENGENVKETKKGEEEVENKQENAESIKETEKKEKEKVENE